MSIVILLLYINLLENIHIQQLFESKNGKIFLKKTEIPERWIEYIGKLFEGDRGERPQIIWDIEGPPILASEVKESLCLNKKNKAIGPDGIVTEMNTSLEDFGIKKLTCVLNDIYDIGIVPDDISISIFTTVPRKARSN